MTRRKRKFNKKL